MGCTTFQDLCEYAHLGRCDGKCRSPHNILEQDLWKEGHEKKLVISDFIDDLLKSDLYMHAALTQLKDKWQGQFEFFCKVCYQQAVWSKKKHHQPFCEQTHDWIPLLTFVTDNGASKYAVGVTDQLLKTPGENGVLKACTSTVAALKELGFTEEDIMKKPKRFKQARAARSRNCHPGFVRSNEEGEGHDGGWRKPYYMLLPPDELQRQRAADPQKFKECTIQLLGTQRAQCLPLDNSNAIEIRGRMNCGPSFTGDEVMVEILDTETHDTKIGYAKESGENGNNLPDHSHEESIKMPRGRVVAITKKICRESMKFLCVADPYKSYLMRPLCGTAPKIHILHSGLAKRHGDANKYVPLYNKQRHLKTDVQLDTKSIDSKLFLVYYLEWENIYVYPLGYASEVYQIGDDIASSQEILDLIYHVHRKDHEHVQEYQQELSHGIPPHWFDGRKDLSEEMTISIDPEECRDVDDALSIKELRDDHGEKQYYVGVHIADASRFLPQNSNQDREAQKRLFTYYTAVPGRNYPMLPPIISEQFCSLQENKKRLALSVTFLLSPGGTVLKKPVIEETVIKNKAQLTYHIAQEIITKDKEIRGTCTSPQVDAAVRRLYRISRNLRKSRMKGSRLYQDHHWESSDHDAHELVEEFMVLANEAVASFLMEDGSEIVPLRKQLPPPQSQVEVWERNHINILPLSLYFQRYVGHVLTRTQLTHGSEVLLQNSVYEELKMTEGDSWQEVASLVGRESLHPQHAVAMADWYRIQNRAIVECPSLENNKHFGLQKDQYTWFTSPIRRYVDIIVHRQVKAKLHEAPAPYTKGEVDFLCSMITRREEHSKKYHRACKQLAFTTKLKKSPVFMQGVIAEIDDEGMDFIFPHMPKGHSQKNNCVRYCDLSVVGKPEVEHEPNLKRKCRLVWHRRIYEDTKFHPSARTPQSAYEVKPQMLDPQQHSVSLSGMEWVKLQDALSSQDLQKASRGELLGVFQNTLNSRKSMERERMPRDVTSEMKGSHELFRHHVRFGLDLSVGGVLQVQMAATCIQGVLQPEPCLVNITPTFDICLLHKKQPIRCFADIATEAVRDVYQNVTQYREIWQPILGMESAYRATKDSDPINVNKVRTQLKRNNNEITGELEMFKSFCKKRQILVHTDTDGKGEQELLHYICLRYDGMPKPNPQSGGFAVPDSTFKNVWMGHAIINDIWTTEVEKNDKTEEKNDKTEEKNDRTEEKKDNMIHAKFTVKQRYVDPPECLYKKKEVCTVELLTKPLPNA